MKILCHKHVLTDQAVKKSPFIYSKGTKHSSGLLKTTIAVIIRIITIFTQIFQMLYQNYA